MKKIIFFYSFFLILSCNSQDKRPVQGKTVFQRVQNAKFKDATKSPLTKKDFKTFSKLEFYDIDSSFVVIAKLTKTPKAPIFEMATTTTRKPLYKKYGILHFTIKGKDLSLNIYQSQDFDRDPKYKDYLFLPFTDKTSGTTSYGGGRYMDIFTTDERKDGTILLDFNNLYNPYCAYNGRYSCPIPPQENHLNIPVIAGVKVYDKY